MEILIANAERIGCEVMADVLKPPPLVDYLGWAIDNIIFTKRESPMPGPYNPELFAYFSEILRALGPTDPCRIVTLTKSAQLGGTVLANIFTLGSMDMDPGDFLYVHPTDDNGRRWSKMKLSPMLKNTTSLTRAFPQKSRDGSDSVMYKERADGRGAIQISGANSPASLSQVTMQRQVQDDLAKWETNAGGDPETQADTRSQAHEFAKIFKISTPLVMPGCRITKNFELGSQEYPEVPCPHCEAYQVLEWDNMLAHLDEDKPEEACFYCTACGGQIREQDRPAMLSRLKWVARNPKAKREHRSFYLWSAYSLLQSWERIARAWLKAKGDPASEQTFMNDTVGLAYRVQGETVDWQVLRDRAAESTYTRGRIPDGALLLTCGVDCQGDRVEWHVRGWGRDNRSWTIEYGVFAGHISDESCRKKLDDLLTWTWLNAYGRKIGLDMLAIDGNAYTEDVWGWAKGHSAAKVIMVRGANTDNAPLLARVKKERNNKGVLLKYSRRFYTFGASTLKMSLYRNLKKTDPLERGYVGLPKGMDDEFYRMLTAERRKGVRNKKTGFTEYRWVKDPDQANEGLDTCLQAEAAAIRLGVRSFAESVWDALDLERQTPPEAAQLDLEDLMTAPAAVAAVSTEPQAPASPPPTETPDPVTPADTWIETQEDWING